MKTENLAKRLSHLREERRWSQKELAKKADLTQAAISQYESGDRAPRQDALVSLARAFGVSVDYLLAEDEADDPLEDPELQIMFRNLQGMSPELRRVIKENIQRLKGFEDELKKKKSEKK